MATIHHLSRPLLLTVLVWSALACLPAIAQRQIGPELSSFSKNEDTSSLRNRLAAVYQAEVGTREIGKNNYGPGPKKYLAVCGLSQGYPYCACFVKWAYLQVGIQTKGTAYSPSWATGSEVFWKKGKGNKTPQQGDVFSLYYANLKRVGHVGFVDVWNDPRADDWVITVEGNTNGEGSREGDGVHLRRRLKRSLYTIASFIP